MKKDISQFEVTVYNPESGMTLPLSYFEDGFITSRQLAEMAGKQHSNMVRDVRRMTSEFSAEDFALLDMHEDEYEDAQGKMRPQFVLGKTAIRFVLTATDHRFRLRLLAMLDELEQEELARKQRALEAHRNRADDVEDALLLVSTFDKHSANRGNQVLRDKQREIRERRRWAEDGC